MKKTIMATMLSAATLSLTAQDNTFMEEKLNMTQEWCFHKSAIMV